MVKSMHTPEWSRYLEWNAAIALVVYGDDRAGLPSYLDLEELTLEEIRDLAEPECLNPSNGLQEAVRATLNFGKGPAKVFAQHLTRLSEWGKGDQVDEPPCLALLAILSLAAENMRDGDGMAANNFYGRLADLLLLDNEQAVDLQRAYRRKVTDGAACSEMLWSSLTTWLDRNEGNRGLPTAYAAGYRNIGPALSQALVRQTDRERLFSAFSAYGLSPRSTIDDTEMRILIEEWLSRVPCPASNNFARLWRDSEDARDRIIDVARLELAAWDGVERGESGEGSARPSRLRLIASLQTFLKTELQLSLGFPAADHDGDHFELLDPTGRTLGTLDFIRRTGGWLVCAPSTIIEPGSILIGDVVLRRPDDQSTATRLPRRLIPLRFDVSLQAYVEQDRVSLGEEHLLLAHPLLVSQLDPVVDRAARPGFRRHDELQGLPAGWVLYEKIQILSALPTEGLKHADLKPLQPLARTQVVLEGGLKIPGNIAKWSTHHPPELRVTSDDSSFLRAELRATRSLAEPAADDRRHSSLQPVLIWSLEREHLQDGDYEISVFDDDGQLGNPVTLRLRTADNPALRRAGDAEVLRHRVDDQLFGLSASAVADTSGFAVAPEEVSAHRDDDRPFAHVPAWWNFRHADRSSSETVVLFAPEADSESCIFTGAHYFLLETVQAGMSSVEGVCKKCGMVKRYRTRRARKKGRSGTQAQQPPQIVVRDLDPIPESVRMTWNTGFDAVCHMGDGPASQLLTVAAQLEAGDLFGDSFIRRLEALGHIEVDRSRSDLTARRWSISNPTLVGLADGRWCLTGFRSERLFASLDDFGYEHEFQLVIDDHGAGPPRVTIPRLEGELLNTLASLIREATNRPVSVLPDAARGLALALPSLSGLIDRLPVTPVINGRGIEKWDSASASFEPTGDANSPGAFRISSFGRTYLYRRDSHIGTMQAILGDARLVKYAAALDSNQTLLGYDAEQRVLFVPLGADLPGLYGRAATLASGMPAVENLEQRALEYRDVPADLAQTLNDKLMS